jgi:peroxiredoxin Q/BCP
MKPDDVVPDFELPDQDGTPRSLTGFLADGPVVLFFYPAAMTAGCTKESCHFRDLAAEFAAAGAHRLGISMDDSGTMGAFAEREMLDFPLLADVDGAVAEAYGVRRRFITPVKRATFVINEQQEIVEVVQSETSMTVHADRALEALARLA